ncbi:DUF262 domain-containing protein [Flavobacterium sp. FlaQc-52]|uniref:DUF262 domain-containing protein n=1 Tax=Flavobacterium sp. FlaQc-52 TaxID=3374185 RepID=UPI003756801C
MHYKYSTITIRELLELSISEKINLSPSYQRGFIWSLPDQKALINTISKGYPLPNLFIRVLSNGQMEMVDGQQRSRTIIKHNKGDIKITSKDNIDLCDNEIFLNYIIQVAYIYEISDEQIREVYYFINKKGINLNDPERQKAYYSDTLFLKLAEELSNNQSLINLDLFSDKTVSRFNDRDFIQELLGYLFKYDEDKKNQINTGLEGIRDKKIYIEKELFSKDINEDEYNSLLNSFEKIINTLSRWNDIYPINKTRYKQKNDFYTIFGYLNKYNQLPNDLLDYQYKILLFLNHKDSDGNQFIRPTNEESEALKNYAINCVSQSNSKKAREERLLFWESILLNKVDFENIEKNPNLLSVLTYLSNLFTEDKIELKSMYEYLLIDVELLNN